jgi:hypothetical protein
MIPRLLREMRVRSTSFASSTSPRRRLSSMHFCLYAASMLGGSDEGVPLDTVQSAIIFGREELGTGIASAIGGGHHYGSGEVGRRERCKSRDAVADVRAVSMLDPCPALRVLDLEISQRRFSNTTSTLHSVHICVQFLKYVLSNSRCAEWRPVQTGLQHVRTLLVMPGALC